MADLRLPKSLADELAKLSLLAEESVDTSDAAEVEDFAGFIRGRFSSILLQERNYDIRALANWFIKRFSAANRSVTNLSLNKLVYFAVERALVEKSILLSPAKIEAWQHGPVFREVYHAAKADGREAVRTLIQRFDLSSKSYVVADEPFEPEDVKFLESVYEDYASFGTGRLVELSHRSGGPWDFVWGNSSRVNFGMEITQEIILHFAPRERPGHGQQES